MGEIPRTLTATRVVMAARQRIHAILNGPTIALWSSSAPARCRSRAPWSTPSASPPCGKNSPPLEM